MTAIDDTCVELHANVRFFSLCQVAPGSINRRISFELSKASVKFSFEFLALGCVMCILCVSLMADRERKSDENYLKE